MTIIIDHMALTTNAIKKIEVHHGATYICDTCIRGTDEQWVNEPMALFYQPDESKVPTEGSQWFVMYYRQEYPGVEAPTSLYISNGITALESFSGIRADNGDIIYSAYRHDYRWSPDGSVMIDGGRDYLKYGGHLDHDRIVKLMVVRDRLVVINP